MFARKKHRPLVVERSRYSERAAQSRLARLSSRLARLVRGTISRAAVGGGGTMDSDSTVCGLLGQCRPRHFRKVFVMF